LRILQFYTDKTKCSTTVGIYSIIDLIKAFDTVYHNELQKVQKWTGSTEQLVHIIHVTHDGPMAKVLDCSKLRGLP